jgi:hypothetical protein
MLCAMHDVFDDDDDDDDDTIHDMLSTHHECDSNCLFAFLRYLFMNFHERTWSKLAHPSSTTVYVFILQQPQQYAP